MYARQQLCKAFSNRGLNFTVWDHLHINELKRISKCNLISKMLEFVVRFQNNNVFVGINLKNTLIMFFHSLFCVRTHKHKWGIEMWIVWLSILFFRQIFPLSVVRIIDIGNHNWNKIISETIAVDPFCFDNRSV